MAFKVEVNGMVYDESNKDCAFIYRRTQGVEIAFIKAVDDNGMFKYYWGLFNSDDRENSIAEILRSGAKWEDLGNDLNEFVPKNKS